MRIGLAQYATVFAENAIDLDILPDLTEADLEKLGVALGHRKRILRAIAALSGGSPAPAASAPLARSEAERRQVTVLFFAISSARRLWRSSSIPRTCAT